MKPLLRTMQEMKLMARNAFLMIPKEIAKYNDLSATAKLLLAQLSDHRNSETGKCFPRRQTLATEIGVSLATVRRALKELRDLKWLTITRTGRASFYRIAMGQLDPSEGSGLTHQMGQIEPSARPYPLYELDYKEQRPRANARPFPSRKSIQTETLERYHELERRKAL